MEFDGIALLYERKLGNDRDWRHTQHRVTSRKELKGLFKDDNCMFASQYNITRDFKILAIIDDVKIAGVKAKARSDYEVSYLPYRFVVFLCENVDGVDQPGKNVEELLKKVEEHIDFY